MTPIVWKGLNIETEWDARGLCLNLFRIFVSNYVTQLCDLLSPGAASRSPGAGVSRCQKAWRDQSWTIGSTVWHSVIISLTAKLYCTWKGGRHQNTAHKQATVTKLTQIRTSEIKGNTLFIGTASWERWRRSERGMKEWEKGGGREGEGERGGGVREGEREGDGERGRGGRGREREADDV